MDKFGLFCFIGGFLSEWLSQHLLQISSTSSPQTNSLHSLHLFVVTLLVQTLHFPFSLLSCCFVLPFCLLLFNVNTKLKFHFVFFIHFLFEIINSELFSQFSQKCIMINFNWSIVIFCEHCNKLSWLFDQIFNLINSIYTIWKIHFINMFDFNWVFFPIITHFLYCHNITTDSSTTKL